MPDVSTTRSYIRRVPVFEKDADKIYEMLGFSKSAWPTLAAKIKMAKREHRPYPVFVDRWNEEHIFFVKPTINTRSVVLKFYQVHVNGKFTHIEFDCEAPVKV